MSVETVPETKLHKGIETSPQRASENVLAVEKVPLAQEWFEKAQNLLARPETAQWDEGHFWYTPGKEGTQFLMQKSGIPYTNNIQVSPSHSYLMLENLEARKAFIITDGVHDNTHRYTAILFTELPDREQLTINQVGAIKFIHDQEGTLTSVMVMDSETHREYLDGRSFSTDQFEMDWYWGYEMDRLLSRGNQRTAQDPTDIIENVLPQLTQATVNGDDTVLLRDYKMRE